MKQICIFIILWSSLLTAHSQRKTEVVVSAEAMNMLYLGLHNPLAFAVQGYKPEEIEIACENCEIVSRYKNACTVKPLKYKPVKITLYSLRKKDKHKLLYDKEFRVKRIPDPTVKLAGKNSGDTLRPIEIKASGILYVVFEDLDFELHAPIKSFIISYTHNNQPYKTKITGNRIPSENINTITQLPSGSKIDFQKVELQMFDGTTRYLNAHFYLKTP